MGLPMYLASLLSRNLPSMKSITSFLPGFFPPGRANSSPVPASNQLTHGEEQQNGNKINKGCPNAQVLEHHTELPHDPSRVPAPPGAPVEPVPDPNQLTLKQKQQGGKEINKCPSAKRHASMHKFWKKIYNCFMTHQGSWYLLLPLLDLFHTLDS